MNSTLKLLAATLVLSVGAMPERASATGGYVSPEVSDNNSLRTGGTQISNGRKKRSGTAVASARRGRDCGESAQQNATMMSNASSLAGFIPIAGAYISALIGMGANEESSTATTKWQYCMHKDMEISIAGVEKSMQTAVAGIHKDLGKQLDESIAEAEDGLGKKLDQSLADIKNEVGEMRTQIAKLEIQAASAHRELMPVHENFPSVCLNCEEQVGSEPQAAAIPSLPERKPETPTAEAPKVSPAVPTSVEDKAMPVPERKKLPELKPGEQYANTSPFSPNCRNGVCE